MAEARDVATAVKNVCSVHARDFVVAAKETLWGVYHPIVASECCLAVSQVQLLAYEKMKKQPP